MPKPRSQKDRVLQWIFLPVALVLWLLRLEKLSLISLIFGAALLIHYAEDSVDSSDWRNVRRA